MRRIHWMTKLNSQDRYFCIKSNFENNIVVATYYVLGATAHRRWNTGSPLVTEVKQRLARLVL